MIHAYCDGSYRNDKCGFGLVISDGQFGPNNILYKTNGIVLGDTSRQVAGELKAAMVAIWWAIKNGVTEIVIVYDYDGIRKWVTGEWNAKKKLTKLYQTWMRNKIEEHKILVRWQHVDGHTGNPGNEMADQLAGEAVS